MFPTFCVCVCVCVQTPLNATVRLPLYTLSAHQNLNPYCTHLKRLKVFDFHSITYIYQPINQLYFLQVKPPKF
uniref:Putative secreted peptide n=1 Tax=Anopheles braziliensis TaxID=58242 RepID=A0A2M3ZN01_9DIPT